MISLGFSIAALIAFSVISWSRTRWTVASQLLMDALVLSILGASVGLIIARWGGALLVRFLPSRYFLHLELIPDASVLGKPDRVRLRFNPAYMQMAAQGKL